MASSSCVLSLAATLASGQVAIARMMLRPYYGHGRPAPAMTECTNTFSTLAGAKVVVWSGQPVDAG
jgi:hypothetical protein